MEMGGNGNVYMGKQWEWEQTFGWRGNGIEICGNGRDWTGKLKAIPVHLVTTTIS